MRFSLFTLFSVSRHIPGPTVCAFHFPCFSVVFFFFFLPYSRSYSVRFSFSTFFSSLAIFQVLCCAFLIFHLLHCFWLYSMSNSVFVSFSTFFSFLYSFQIIDCAFHIFHVFQCFSPYSRSYSVRYSFFTFFSVSTHIPCPTM